MASPAQGAAAHLAQYFSIHPVDPESRLIRRAAAIVRDGGVIAYPTDSSYALGCRIGDAEAAVRIRALRQVDDKHDLTLVCRDLAEMGRYAQLDNWQFRIVKEGVPGSFTFLLPATREVPRRLKHPRRRTIGVRVPDHAVVQALLTELDEPLLSSTLIPPGVEEPLNDPAAIRAQYEHALDLIIDSGACHLEPTTVIDLAVTPPVVRRLGRGDPARLGLAGVGSQGA
jgi:tRNA threonylcarbamoyl adenosine modification protein (Sua5/YciO/YrdC/YwlC family)